MLELSRIQQSLDRLDRWIESEDFRGWDPHDALNSPVLRRLTLGNRLIGIAWVQLLRRSPINLRPLLRVSKKTNAKAMALFLATFVRRSLITPQARDLEQVARFTAWLSKHSCAGYHGCCWGYPFDWPNRGFFAPAGTPTVVNTSFVGLAFLDAYHLCSAAVEARRLLDSDFLLGIARSACEFILRDLNCARNGDELCFSYTTLDRRLVHNANTMAAWLLAATFSVTSEPCLAESALAAARYTARRQRPDGSWPYGEAASDSWIDNFHTGFVLVGLKRMSSAVNTQEFDSVLRKGYRFWKEMMFTSDFAPKYYVNKLYPVDAHSVAQAILTFSEFQDMDPEALDCAFRVASWALDHMQDKDGYFHYQIHSRYRIRIAYMRWAQAWMQRALTELIYRRLRCESGLQSYTARPVCPELAR